MNIVITGASSGIGNALASIFARNGHAVLVVARREDRLVAICENLHTQYGACVNCLVQDITAPGAPQTVLEEAVKLFGKVHVLVNSAGMSPYQKFRELSYNHVRQILAVNICSATELCFLFMDHMSKHGEPSHVVNVCSVGGYTPLPRLSVYTGSKHYIRAFTNLLNYEYRSTNIQVSGLYPGGTLTEFPALAGQRVKEFAKKTMLTPGQVAAIAYPAILKGKRVIVPGIINQVAVVIGKLLPFPIAIRIMEFIYNQNVEPVPPTYPS